MLSDGLTRAEAFEKLLEAVREENASTAVVRPARLAFDRFWRFRGTPDLYLLAVRAAEAVEEDVVLLWPKKDCPICAFLAAHDAAMEKAREG